MLPAPENVIFGSFSRFERVKEHKFQVGMPTSNHRSFYSSTIAMIILRSKIRFGKNIRYSASEAAICSGFSTIHYTTLYCAKTDDYSAQGK